MLRPALKTIAQRANVYPQAQAAMAALRLARSRVLPVNVDQVAEVDGLTTMEQVQVLHDLVAKLPDGSRIVEVGVWHGRSAIAMALACRGTRKKVYAVDPWVDYPTEGSGVYPTQEGQAAAASVEEYLVQQGQPSLEEVYQSFLKNRQRFRVEQWLEVIRATSLEAARSWSHGPIAMAFIDGNHDEADVLADLNAWAPLLTPDGHLLGDDLPWPGVTRALTSYMRDHPDLWVATRDGKSWKLIKTPY